MKKEDQEKLKALWNQLDEISQKIEEIRDPMQEKLDNASEAWLESAAGKEMTNEFETLCSVIYTLEELSGDLENLS